MTCLNKLTSSHPLKQYTDMSFHSRKHSNPKLLLAMCITHMYTHRYTQATCTQARCSQITHTHTHIACMHRHSQTQKNTRYRQIKDVYAPESTTLCVHSNISTHTVTHTLSSGSVLCMCTWCQSLFT